METIITISGPAGHGKDTTGTYIKKSLEMKNRRVLMLGFGDYLKFIASKYFGYKGDDYKHEPEQRALLQKLGTEVGRKHDEEFWVNVVRNTILAFKDEFDVCIITDARFPNECKILKDTFNVINLKVIRRNFDNGMDSEKKKHASEIALNFYDFDYYIDSDNIPELEQKIDSFIEKYLTYKPSKKTEEK